MIGIGQFCINVSDLEQSVTFYTQVLGLKVEHRIELPGLTEAVLVGDDGAARIQLAQQLEQDAPIEHSNGFWKLYLNTDDSDTPRPSLRFGRGFLNRSKNLPASTRLP
ncbi:hypothetical protein GZ77_20700 [Endozoicomonas montiporae]|uniref:Glyoxalase/fosfomycin resistance/dioxygenase domain-containing protein n=1 Tax=Endozoicomonas montiporae TaxID=1027273 RepID=A0A081N339_9GAMM|nr:VOC family protein [Endozoicomonas montiporae]KEQ12862.1 hypothetical protein GZ77_20700 [Endozoicomonas montiporae]